MAKIGSDKEWCPSAAGRTEFIQIEFSSAFRLCAVAIQGHHTLQCFVSSYRVAYSLNGSTWLNVTLGNKIDLVGTLFALLIYAITLLFLSRAELCGKSLFRGRHIINEVISLGKVLFSDWLIIGGSFAFQNGLKLDDKIILELWDNSVKQLKTANPESLWAYIREGLLLDGT